MELWGTEHEAMESLLALCGMEKLGVSLIYLATISFLWNLLQIKGTTTNIKSHVSS
jgi:hypothetical protein